MIALNDTQLVIIDIQGKLSQIVHESERVLYNSRIMIEGCRLLGIPIVWLEQLPEKLGATHPSIAEVLTGLSPIAKSCFSAYANASFRDKTGMITTVRDVTCAVTLARTISNRASQIPSSLQMAITIRSRFGMRRK